MAGTGPIKVVHVITGLGVGGAEMVLYRLLSTLDRSTFDSSVISLTTDQPVGDLIRALGIPVTALGFRPGVPDPRIPFRLSAALHSLKPDLIQTWMYHADLFGGIAARLAGSPPVVWGIRHTVATSRALKPATYAVARLNAMLSNTLPQKIVCVAEAARLTHIRLGYSAKRMVVIPNGIDSTLFRPDPAARRDIRRELGIGDDVPLVGLCARFHPDKDHRTFFRSAGIVHAAMPQVHFILWGLGIDHKNVTLTQWMDEAGLDGVVHLLGRQNDSNRLFAALDLAVLSSATEAFPGVIAEAMSCGLPCVATDVGDSRTIIGDTGIVAQPRDPQALAKGMLELLSDPSERHSRGERARQRIKDQYSLEQMATAYARLYRDIIHQHSA